MVNSIFTLRSGCDNFYPTLLMAKKGWYSVAYLNRGSQRVANYITSQTVLQLRIFYNDLIRLD